jgi:hypothetical protein
MPWCRDGRHDRSCNVSRTPLVGCLACCEEYESVRALVGEQAR